MLAACGFLGRINSHVGSTYALMFHDVANTCFGSEPALWLGAVKEALGVALVVAYPAPPTLP